MIFYDCIGKKVTEQFLYPIAAFTVTLNFENENK